MHHASYVRHLNNAVADPKVRNIALTGRFGSGKSSILDEFLRQQEAGCNAEGIRRKTLRISINTLGPDDKEDITNRIQKELVKQLVYRTKPGKIRSTQFARRANPSPWTVGWQGTLLGLATVGLFRLFGIWPDSHAFTGWEALPGLLFSVIVGALAVAGHEVGDTAGGLKGGQAPAATG